MREGKNGKEKEGSSRKKRLEGTLNGIETETEIKQKEKEENAKYHQLTMYRTIQCMYLI